MATGLVFLLTKIYIIHADIMNMPFFLFFFLSQSRMYEALLAEDQLIDLRGEPSIDVGPGPISRRAFPRRTLRAHRKPLNTIQTLHSPNDLEEVVPTSRPVSGVDSAPGAPRRDR